MYIKNSSFVTVDNIPTVRTDFIYHIKSVLTEGINFKCTKYILVFYLTV